MQGRPGLTILLLLLGGILLLPGFCALVIAIGFTASGFIDLSALAMLVPLWLFCLLISWGGVHLIRKALR